MDEYKNAWETKEFANIEVKKDKGKNQKWDRRR